MIKNTTTLVGKNLQLGGTQLTFLAPVISETETEFTVYVKRGTNKHFRKTRYTYKKDPLILQAIREPGEKISHVLRNKA